MSLKTIWEKIINFGKTKEAVSATDISLIKSIIKNTLSLFVKYKEYNADKNVDWTEWAMIAKTALPLVSDIRKYEILKLQILDFTTAEGIELVEYCKSLGILPIEAENIVKHAISAIEKGVILYKEDLLPIWDSIKNIKK